MYEDNTVNEPKFSRVKDLFSHKYASWIIFGTIILAGIIVRIFLWDYTSSDIFVWKEAAELLLSGENPYLRTIESFQIPGSTHFYAYFPLWMYICSLILLIFPQSWFFVIVKGLILFFDIQVIILLYVILQNKVENKWRLKIPIAIWFITPMVIMTGAMHGKFDSLMFVFILLACLFNERDSLIPEAIFLSLGILIKPITLIIVPFFFLKEVREKNFKKILLKIGLIIFPIILFSIPFLANPIIYFQGVLGVHITREHDLGFVYALISMALSTAKGENILKICLTVIIAILWVTIIIIAYLKKLDIYSSCFYTFTMFNSLYWVFLIQYTTWIYTFYIIFTSKSKLKHWALGSITLFLIILSTVLMAVLGLFVKNGL
ncbi:MAG: glycosyltransferase 87 family protein [Candidatus Heimdallarchaeota archaeon]